MEQIEKFDLCPFCEEGLEIIHGMPLEEVTADFFVTQNAFPYEGTECHYLIVPKEHKMTVMDLTDIHWGQIGQLLKWIIQTTTIEAGGFFLRFGDMHRNGSSIEHIHFQVISGTKSDQDSERESLKVKLGYK